MPIRPELPSTPEFGTPLPAVRESLDTLHLLALRRSTPVSQIGDPGPSQADLDMLLRLAMRVPDHRKLEPWRFLVFAGDGRQALGEMFAVAREAGGGDLAVLSAALAEARALPLRAPAIVAVISSPMNDPKNTPVWEQELSVGAVCQTLMLAACAAGWAACWITEWPAYDARVQAAMGLNTKERIAGFIYLGSAKDLPVERQRPDPAQKVTWRIGV